MLQKEGIFKIITGKLNFSCANKKFVPKILCKQKICTKIFIQTKKFCIKKLIFKTGVVYQ